MKISTKSRYGLRILLHIACTTKENENAQGRAIAEAQGISEAYLEQIMIPLKNGGFVRTQRGCKGGYILNKRPEDVTVLDVMETFEGHISLVDCVSGDDCERINECITSDVWRQLSECFRNEASGITLANILERGKQQPQNLNFVI